MVKINLKPEDWQLLGLSAGQLGNNLISGGLQSGAGNLFQGIGNVGAAIPGPWGAAISAGANILGGISNKLFGSKLNNENIARVENNISELNSFQSNVADFDSLSQNWSSAPVGMQFNNGYIGKDGLFSNKAKRLARELRDKVAKGTQWVSQNLQNNATNIQSDQIQNLLSNYAAYGGPIHIKPSKRGTFTAAAKKRGKSVQEFASQVLANKENYTPAMIKKANFARNASKWKHEDGGRVNFSTYKPVFNRAFIPQNMEQIQDSLINRGFSPAQRAAILGSVLHESGGNPKAQRGQFRGIAQWSKERYPNTENLGDQIHYLIESSLESTAPHWSDGGSGAPFIQRAIDGYNAFWNPNIGPYNATMYYNKGYIRPKEGQARVNRAVEASNMYNIIKGKKKALGGDLNNDFSNGVTYIGNGGSHEENPFEGIQFGIDENGTPNLVEEGEVIFNDYVYSDRIKVPKGVRGKYKLGNNKNMTFAQAAKKISRESEERSNDPLSKAGLEIGLSRLAQEQEALKEEWNMQQNNKYAKGGDLRYAPVIGNAIGLLSNLFSKPDYSRATTIQEAANSAGRYTPVSYTPVGNYLQYKPMDRDYYINKLNAESGATRRAVMNSSNPSRNATLLALDYNTQTKLGDLSRQAEEYNFSRKKEVQDFNRQTDITNSELGLKAAMANQSAQQSANQIRLSGITNAMNMRDEIDARRSAAISSNLSGLSTSLGNIGIDQYNRRQAGLTMLNSGIPLTTKPDGVTQKEWENYLKLRDSNPEWFTTNGNKPLLQYKTYPYKLDVDTSWLNIPFNNHGIV